jgi:hypothetical protein
MLDENPKLGNSAKEICLRIFFPIIFPAVVLFNFIDKHFFAEYFAKRRLDKRESRFASEIRERVPCLFIDFGAQRVPNIEPTPLVFDFAVVTLKVDTMLIRFVRGRMDLEVDVAPAGKPGAWRESSTVAKHSDFSVNADRKVDYYGLKDFGQFFRSNFDVLRYEISRTDWRASTGWLVPFG